MFTRVMHHVGAPQKAHPMLGPVVPVKNKVDDTLQQEFRTKFNVVDSIPKGLPKMEDVVRDFLMGNDKYIQGDSVPCLAKLVDLWGDPTYNRPDEISFNKCDFEIYNVISYLLK